MDLSDDQFVDPPVDPRAVEMNTELAAMLCSAVDASRDVVTASALIAVAIKLAQEVFHVHTQESRGVSASDPCDGSCQIGLATALVMNLLKGMRLGGDHPDGHKNIVMALLMAISIQEDDPHSEKLLYELESKLAHNDHEAMVAHYEAWFQAELESAPEEALQLISGTSVDALLNDLGLNAGDGSE